MEPQGFRLKADDQVTLQNWKNEGQRIVFTNGCFDLIHSGHIQYLTEAKELGDRLVIGLNTDDSVRKLKGENRPILLLQDRISMLSALKMVDLVIPFGEDTPELLIQAIRPDVLVKGGDYNIENIVGANFVQSNGGVVKVLSFKTGVSTSSIINKILKIRDNG
jgi:rfaE bifunctional protein nucleotidyltransferase chain/domain